MELLVPSIQGLFRLWDHWPFIILVPIQQEGSKIECEAENHQRSIGERERASEIDTLASRLKVASKNACKSLPATPITTLIPFKKWILSNFREYVSKQKRWENFWKCS